MKIKKPNILKFLDISTGHITLGDSLLLAQKDVASTPLVCIRPYEYGWYVFTTSEADRVPEYLKAFKKTGYSKAFRDLYRYACKKGYYALNIDQDGETYAELPQFDW